ncbi:DUF2197 domain-containing protein [Marinithermofilum abyssi]|uniref:DUF2197 domain-containing protein n=1 Tax=Marinithermofilum abyssi TaxID=1571185 RepID=UPI001664220D
MKVTCLLCERPFSPSPLQAKKLRKHPHRIFLCPSCHERISTKTIARRNESSSAG